MRVRALVLAPALLGGMVACWSLGADLGGLSGGSLVDAQAGDGPGTVSEAGPVPDAGSRFCPGPSHAFCADFDERDPLAGWSDSTTEANGTLGLSDRAFSGGSLVARLPRRTAEKGYAAVGRRFEGPWRRVIVDFEVLVAPPDFEAGDSNFGIVCIAFHSGVETAGACMSITSSAVLFGGLERPRMSYDEWIHVHYDIDPIAKTASARIGDEAEIRGTVAVPASTADPAIFVQVGVLGYNVPAPAAVVHVDNVTIDFP